MKSLEGVFQEELYLQNKIKFTDIKLFENLS